MACRRQRFRQMETTHLQEYVVLAHRRSFTEAARDLHITQSTLSKHVAALEREFGRELFVRDRSGIRLTEAGTMLYEQAVQLLRTMQKAYKLVRAAGEQPAAGEIAFGSGAASSPDLRCKCLQAAKRFGLSKLETGALALFLEERGFAAIQQELGLSRDDVAEVLAAAYRKLKVDDKQAALDVVQQKAGGVDATAVSARSHSAILRNRSK